MDTMISLNEEKEGEGIIYNNSKVLTAFTSLLLDQPLSVEEQIKLKLGLDVYEKVS